MEFTKQQEKALAAYRKCDNGPAFNRVRAYVIIAPQHAAYCETAKHTVIKELQHGSIKVAYPADGAGKLQVFVWECKNPGMQYGWASGYGYDKLSAALKGIKFDDIVFTDHPENWQIQLRNAGYTVIQAI